MGARDGDCFPLYSIFEKQITKMKKYIVTVLLLLTCVVAFAQVNKSGVTHKGEVTTTKNKGEVDLHGQIDPCPQLTPYGEIISYTATMDTLHGNLDGTVNIAVSIKVNIAENADSVGFELSTSSNFSVITAHKSFVPVDTILYKDTFKLLQANQTYYVRAFIANCPGVVYSDTVDVTTTGTYTLSFFAHGGTGTMTDQNFTHGVSQRIKANEFARANADFAGWATDPSGCDTWYADTAYMTLTASDSVYAQWKTWCTGAPDLIYEKGSVNRIDSVKDHQGNWYKVVQIGSQCWLAENMRATTSPSTNTNFVENPAATASFSGKKAYYIGNSLTSVRDRGLLYNWNAAVDTFNTSYSETHTNPDAGAAVDAVFIGMRRGICPSGWHIPTDAEWNALNSTTDVGAAGVGKLAGGCEWTSYGTATQAGNYAYSKRDSSCFKARATGFYNGTSNDFESSNGYAGFWSATRSNVSSQVWNRAFGSDDEKLWRNDDQKKFGYSVRCVRNTITDTITFMPNGGSGTMTQQVVIRGIATTLNPNTFTPSELRAFAGWDTRVTECYGTISYLDGATITTNGNITLYAQWTTYCVGTPNSYESGLERIDSVSDHQGNWYQVVQIGTQCWLKENMRCTTGPTVGVFDIYNSSVHPSLDQQNFLRPTALVNDCASCSEYGDPQFLAKYGYLYTWQAAADLPNITTTQSGQIKGICPQGWHLPAYTEYVTLFNVVKNNLVGQSSVTPSPNWTNPCGGNEFNATNTRVATALSAKCDWDASSVFGSAGIDDAYRNVSGFSALPAHDYNTHFWAVYSHALFWTSENSGTQASSFAIGAQNAGIMYNKFNYNKNHVGRSVRCVRDAE